MFLFWVEMLPSGFHESVADYRGAYIAAYKGPGMLLTVVVQGSVY